MSPLSGPPPSRAARVSWPRSRKRESFLLRRVGPLCKVLSLPRQAYEVIQSVSSGTELSREGRAVLFVGRHQLQLRRPLIVFAPTPVR